MNKFEFKRRALALYCGIVAEQKFNSKSRNFVIQILAQNSFRILFIPPRCRRAAAAANDRRRRIKNVYKQFAWNFLFAR